MVFQAFPCEAKATIGSLLRTQKTVHGNESSVIVPCLLLVFMCCVLLHYHIVADAWSHGHGKFLMLTIAQMTPLAIADMKILRCEAPLRLFCIFSEKVFIMGTTFLGLRLLTDARYGHQVEFRDWFFLASAIPILVMAYGFRPTKEYLIKHLDIICLMTTMLVATLMIEATEEGLGNLWRAMKGELSDRHANNILQNFLGTHLSNMIELGIFMPAMWVIFRARPANPNSMESEPAGVRLKAVCFFGWLLAFYMFEDLASAWAERRISPRISLVRVGHFLLLADFAAFILGHFYDQAKFDKLRGSVMNMFLLADSV